MVKQNHSKLNFLEKALPEGLLVDAAWLRHHGFSTSLLTQYVQAGKLARPAPRVYRRPRGSLKWQQVVISLQMLLNRPLTVGGRTALELQGFSHYLSNALREVHLYGPNKPPTWLPHLQLETRFLYHNEQKLFRRPLEPEDLSMRSQLSGDDDRKSDWLTNNLTLQHWGEWDWPIVLSTPERAILELLDELPKHETFEQVDKLMGSLSSLSPRRLEKLLADCKNVKVKRLFFFFADRHKHAWNKYLDQERFDLGKGKRMLVKGGRYDPRYGITVPEEFSAG